MWSTKTAHTKDTIYTIKAYINVLYTQELKSALCYIHPCRLRLSSTNEMSEEKSIPRGLAELPSTEEAPVQLLPDANIVAGTSALIFPPSSESM